MQDKTKEWADAQAAGGSTLESLMSSARQSITIDFPGWRGKPKDQGGLEARVTLWLLGFDELTQAELAALKFMRDSLKMSENDVDRLEGVRDFEVKVQTLHRAMRSVEQPTVPFARFEATIRQLEPDTVQALYDAFIEFSAARSPFQHLKGLDELSEVLEYLGKGLLDETYLARFDATSLRRITRSLAVQVSKLASASSSGSSLPSGGAP